MSGLDLSAHLSRIDASAAHRKCARCHTPSYAPRRPICPECSVRAHADAAALDEITAHMNGKEWTATTLDLVAIIVRDTGRTIADTSTPASTSPAS